MENNKTEKSIKFDVNNLRHLFTECFLDNFPDKVFWKIWDAKTKKLIFDGCNKMYDIATFF